LFETVVPERTAPRSRRLFYETLPLSIGAHVLVIATILGSTLWKVGFPAQPPRVMAAYQLASSPPPPPPPPPPPARSAPVQTNVAIPMPDVAPTVIPDAIPEVLPDAPPATDAPVGTGGVEGGIEGGVEGGVIGGTIGGVVTEDPPPPKLPPGAPIEVARDAPLPVEMLNKDLPTYPMMAQIRNWEDELVIRYVIGKDGRVKDVKVLQPPEHATFAKATLERVWKWRFKPYVGDDGEAREVSHELTVEFRLIRKGTAPPA
jgi:protein TonB